MQVCKIRKVFLQIFYEVIVCFIRNGCSIFMNVKRVNLMFKHLLLDLEKTNVPCDHFHTHYNSKHPFRIPISVSLLNHSNLFL